MVVAVCLSIALYTFACFTPYVQGYPLYPIYLIKCGRLPVTGSTFAGSKTYSLQGDLHYGPDVTVDTFFCSEQEALAAGFRRWEPYKDTNQ